MTTLTNTREVSVSSAHPLSQDQIMTAIRHAQRQGEPSYVLWSATR